MANNPPIGSIYHLYTTYSPCLLGGYMLPTTFYGNQKQPLILGYMLVFGGVYLHLYIYIYYIYVYIYDSIIFVSICIKTKSQMGATRHHASMSSEKKNQKPSSNLRAAIEFPPFSFQNKKHTRRKTQKLIPCYC